MVSKVSVLALCAAASLNGATAAHHRHQHPKRAVVYETDVVVVTQYNTVTVGAGAPATAVAAAPSAVAQDVQAAAVPEQEEAPAAASPTTLATQVKAPIATSQAASANDLANLQPTASPAPNAASTVSSSGGKRGLAYNDPNMVKTLLGQTDAISWVYNWGNEAWDLDVDVPFIPTMWGEKFASDWAASAEKAISNGAEALFSFNEPDNAGQANMAPAYAATKHQEWMNDYADRIHVVAPSISSSQEAGQGIDWLTQFFDACNGNCKYHSCNTHWYGPGGEAGAQEFLTHLQNVNQVPGCQGKPLWVTEFMPQGSASDNEVFMQKVIQAMESDEYSFVHKYSYFMCAVGESYLMSTESEANSLGKIYLDLA